MCIEWSIGIDRRWRDRLIDICSGCINPDFHRFIETDILENRNQIWLCGLRGRSLDFRIYYYIDTLSKPLHASEQWTRFQIRVPTWTFRGSLGWVGWCLWEGAGGNRTLGPHIDVVCITGNHTLFSAIPPTFLHCIFANHWHGGLPRKVEGPRIQADSLWGSSCKLALHWGSACKPDGHFGLEAIHKLTHKLNHMYINLITCTCT